MINQTLQARGWTAGLICRGFVFNRAIVLGGNHISEAAGN
jgi:hypothetical protein